PAGPGRSGRNVRRRALQEDGALPADRRMPDATHRQALLPGLPGPDPQAAGRGLSTRLTGEGAALKARPRYTAPSSSGLGRRPFTAKTRVRVPLGSPAGQYPGELGAVDIAARDDRHRPVDPRFLRRSHRRRAGAFGDDVMLG